MFQEVLEEAFRGCGTSLRKAKKSVRFRELLNNRIDLERRYGSETTIGQLVRAHAAEAALPLNTLSASKARSALRGLVGSGNDAETQCLMVYLGERLIAAAAKRLPTSFKRSAALWPELSAEEQAAVLRTLYDHILLIENILNDEDPFAGQPKERVLPNRFETSTRRASKNSPNCVGRALLFAGFAQQAGARSIVLIPARTSLQFFEALYYQGLQLVDQNRDLLILEGRQILSFLSKHKKRFERRLKRRSWLHATMLVELKDGCWMLVDPNMKTVMKVPNQGTFRGCQQRVTAWSAINPGIGVLFRAIGPQEEALEQSAYRSAVVDFLRLMKPLVEAPKLDERRITQELARFSKAQKLSAVRNWLTQNNKKGVEGIRCMIDVTTARRLAAPTKRRITYAAARRRAIQQVVEDELRNIPNVAAAQTGIGASEYLHAEGQLFSVEMGLASSVLGHLAYCMECSAPVEEVLTKNVSCMYRLYHRMLSLFEGRRKKQDEQAVRAAQLLAASPYVPRSVEPLLVQLRERGIFLPQKRSYQWLRRKTNRAKTSHRKVRRLRVRAVGVSLHLPPLTPRTQPPRVRR